MKGKSIILFGVGSSVGFIAGNIFLAIKIIESEKMRSALSDIIADKIAKLLYGETTPNRSQKVRVSYRDYYNSRKANRVCYKSEELIFATRADAEEVLSKMKDIAKDYGIVSISDYYELAGFTSTDYQLDYISNKDASFQWTDLEKAYIVRVREGYTIKLPLASRIKI